MQRSLKHRLEYKYLVQYQHTPSMDWTLCCYDDNILWMCTIYRKSKRSNPFVFPTKQLAKKAIKDSIKYSSAKRYKWSRDYRIIPVVLYV